jgi:hypothetical protein
MTDIMAKVLDILDEGRISVNETQHRIITIDIGADGWKINKQGFSTVGGTDDNLKAKHLRADIIPDRERAKLEHLRHSSPFCRWSRTLSY